MKTLSLHRSLSQMYHLRDQLASILNTLVDLAEVYQIQFDRDIWGLREVYNDEIDVKILQKNLRVNIDAEIHNAYAPFQIAVAGEFTRGKSTLLNALIGRTVLTANRLPNTATRTNLLYGPHDRLQIFYFDQHNPVDIVTDKLPDDLAHYTSDVSIDQEHYQSILRGDKQSLAERIKQVNVWIDSAYLHERNFKIIDTPGLGSSFETHQIATFNTVPHVDAVLFLTQFNALISEEELIFLNSMRDHLSRFLFVLTKADLAKQELDSSLALDRALSFTSSVLTKELNLDNIPVYPVSAIKALQNGPDDENGFINLILTIDDFIARTSGQSRLRSLIRSAIICRYWVRRKLEQEHSVRSSELRNLDKGLDTLLLNIGNSEAMINNLLQLLACQNQQTVQHLLNGLSTLSERIHLAIMESLKSFSVKQLYEAPIHIRHIIWTVVHMWIEECKNTFQHFGKLLEGYTQNSLTYILGHHQHNIQWQLSPKTECITTLDHPLPHWACTLNIFEQLTLAVGVPHIRYRKLMQIFGKTESQHRQSLYDQLLFGDSQEHNLHNQCEVLFEYWTSDLYANLKETIHLTFAQYRQNMEQEERRIVDQRLTIASQLNSIDKHFVRLQEIDTELDCVCEIIVSETNKVEA